MNAMAPMSKRPVESIDSQGWTAKKTSTAITTRSSVRCNRRPTRRNAPAEPFATAALRMIRRPSSDGIAGSGKLYRRADQPDTDEVLDDLVDPERTLHALDLGHRVRA
jgi:hypothetical protein